ncbi:hypothetical protein GQ53DRAFT_836245 [Thozetella sp. PMI_491]|nr:hypothetical protein GQ53DRAFT_836245 [Thozetella sp. PMI_491]
MDHPTLDVLVRSLGAAFEAGLDSLARWDTRQHAGNHYHGRPASAPATVKCALSASYDVSSHRIRATYQVAFAIIGLEFAVGNESSRSCLAANLELLEESVCQLSGNVAAAQARPVDFGDALRTSESVRIRCIAALAEQYRRLSAGRALPQELPIPKPRAPLPPAELPRAATASDCLSPPAVTPCQDCDQASAHCPSSPGATGISEPPSPPPTPKMVPGCLPDAEPTPSSGPRNGVFSIFCAHAMALQVDLGREPPGPPRRCMCGFDWAIPELPLQVDSVGLKHGFRLTRRFLAKSHCGRRRELDSAVDAATEPSPDSWGNGYGCIFCTSTGRTERYETISQLRIHIDAVHTKWQMLHDHDMASMGR